MLQPLHDAAHWCWRMLRAFATPNAPLKQAATDGPVDGRRGRPDRLAQPVRVRSRGAAILSRTDRAGRRHQRWPRAARGGGARLRPCVYGYEVHRHAREHGRSTLKTMLVASSADDVMLTRAFTGLQTKTSRPSIVAPGWTGAWSAAGSTLPRTSTSAPATTGQSTGATSGAPATRLPASARS